MGRGFEKRVLYLPPPPHLTLAGSLTFVLGPSGLIWLLVALFVECCQGRPLTVLIMSLDYLFVGLQASY